MKKVLVLGAGRVGSLIATDLAKDFKVVICDNDIKTRQLAEDSPNIQVSIADLSISALVRMMIRRHDPDLVVGALPSVLGFQTLKTVIDCGKNYVDISFMSEDPMVLDDTAKEKDVTAIIDCGLMPGIGNMIAGHFTQELEDCHTIRIYVGGIPANPVAPFNYKAPFAPSDVIEEYTRPARVMVDGKQVVFEALTGVESISFFVDTEFAMLEAFNTDGLRTLLTLGVPNMVEKTLRWPGHADLMRMLRDEGMLEDPEWLYKYWQYSDPLEHDITFMRVEAKGIGDGDDDLLTFNLIDRYDDKTGNRSMSRTTAFPCTIVSRMVLDGTISDTGVIAPETLGKDPSMFHFIMTELGIKYGVSVTPVCSIGVV